MRISVCSGTLFSHTFLAIFAVSHAFVFWIPVWKSTSVLRYHPKKGWTPLKTRGSGILKASHNYNFYSPSAHKPLHHFYSTHDQKYQSRQAHLPFHHHRPHSFLGNSVHHKYKEWRLPRIHLKKSPLLNLNGHHPLCPLCHIADHWSKPRKPFHHHHNHHGFFGGHHHHKFHHSASDHFSNGMFNNFAKFKRPFHKPGGYHHSPHFSGFPGFRPISQFPKKFSSNFSPFPPKFSNPFPNNDFPQFSKNNNHNHKYNSNHQSSPYHRYRNTDHRYPTQSSSYRRKPKEHVSYHPDSLKPLSSLGTGAYQQQKIRDSSNEISHSPMSPPTDLINQPGPVVNGPLAVISNSNLPHVGGENDQREPEEQPVTFPKDFSNFGFSGFGTGQKGHGWGGWDW